MQLALSLVLAGSAIQAYYLPGFPPQSYGKGETVQLTVNALNSRDSMSLLPYDYYYEKFHFCQPAKLQVGRESLGSVLFGDRMYNSPFEVKMLEDAKCVKMCTSTVSADDAKFINLKIKEEYFMDWYVDNLPAAQISPDDDGNEYYQIGFDLGALYMDSTAPDKLIPFLHNHYDITIEYHTKEDNKHRVVGVIVNPRSVLSVEGGTCEFEGKEAELQLSEELENKVTYSYSVIWKHSPTPWATRWDKYLHVTQAKVHWFSIINSIVIVLMLSSMIAVILLRALHKDISRYNRLFDEDFADEIGWKLVHADVFRPPRERMLLSVLVGNGVQILLMCAISIVFALLGFLSPSSRGTLTTVSLVFYILLSGVAGYVSSRLYKMMKGDSMYKNVALTAVLVPGYVFVLFLILNFVLVGAQSSAAVPFTTMLALIGLWFLVSIPLCIAGGFFGFNQQAVEDPAKTAQIPREIPPQNNLLNPWLTTFLAGFVPFGAIFIEVYFIMNSIWFHQIYYMFGFLFLVFIILVLTSSEVAILMCYNHLCAEDYKWAWRSFAGPATAGLYIFLYSIVYFVRMMQVDNVASTVLYFGWSLAVSALFSVLTGSIGYLSCLVFVRTIFGIIKID
ncbi:UNVERIFIED_CONTAM: hypothetical protein HDU68_006885 [Siphonaria sp. JEL0065]|nr:hypothetical protein HDU68_006885 [Siphonaria sp. JEL0065]